MRIEGKCSRPSAVCFLPLQYMLLDRASHREHLQARSAASASQSRSVNQPPNKIQLDPGMIPGKLSYLNQA